MALSGSLIRFFTLSIIVQNFFVLLTPLSLSCDTQDLHRGIHDLSLRDMGFSLIVAWGLICSKACGILFP